MLSFKGIACTLAENGMEALQLLMRGDRFDIILMDYHMPILSGLETIEKIKELFNKQGEAVPLVVLHTSSEEHEIITSFRQEERSFCLMKPIKSNELYEMIKRVMIKSKEDQRKLENASKSDGSTIYDYNAKVLLADDNPVNMALNLHIMGLIMPHAELVKVVNGVDAVEACKQHKFDLILMDVQMPEMDGIEATKRIRNLNGYEEIPIIGITAGNVVGEKEKCLANGMSGFLPKPIRQKDLEEAILALVKIDVVEEEIKKEKHLNVQTLRDQVGDDADFKAYFVDLVISEIGQIANVIRADAEQMNLENLKRNLHKLRGTASTCGLFKLSELALQLERKISEIEVSPVVLQNDILILSEEIKIGTKLITELLNA